jgi:hypothetical protein
MRRKEASCNHLQKAGSLPEDGHHYPTETPEQWLLVKQKAANDLDVEDGRPMPSRGRHRAASKQPRVPFLDLEVTPELLAISMGKCQAMVNMLELHCHPVVCLTVI